MKTLLALLIAALVLLAAGGFLAWTAARPEAILYGMLAAFVPAIVALVLYVKAKRPRRPVGANEETP